MTLPNDWFRPPGKWGGSKPSSGGGKQERGQSPVTGMNGFQTVPVMVNLSDTDLFKKVTLHQVEKGELKDVIILDTGLTIPATFMNPAFLTNSSVSKTHLTMTTNAGMKVLTMKGQLKSFVELWYDPTQVVNILGFASLRDRFETCYDWKKDEFTVFFKQGGTIVFQRCLEGLYIFCPAEKFLKWVASQKMDQLELEPRSGDATLRDGSKPRSDAKSRSDDDSRVVSFKTDPEVRYYTPDTDEDDGEKNTNVDAKYNGNVICKSKPAEVPATPTSTDKTGMQQMVTSVAENSHAFTHRQFENAKRARRLYQIMGRPTVENLKALIRMNAIKDCPVTVEDVDIAEKIFGPDIGTLKGKSVR